MAGERLHIRDPRNAIRIGADTYFFADLYYRVLRAAWWKVLLFFLVAYLAANTLFGAIYASCGDCVDGVRPGNFADAFFFSVQTISTIGYGHLFPRTEFAEAIVTVESIVGLMGFAVVTGIVFSKFALSNARVMFSRPILITRYGGGPALLFRIANARGNDIVEASLRISVLLPHTTVEGEHMRRLHDLDLRRSTSPMFSLSWLIVHEIDPSSPLWGMSREALLELEPVFIVSMTGLDGTLNDNVHARHLYRHEDILFDRVFEDVVSNDEDGRLVLDLRKFHATRAPRIDAAPVVLGPEPTQPEALADARD